MTSWWNQISRARRLIDELCGALSAGHHVLLCTPETMPWRSQFMDIVTSTLAQEHGSRRVRIHSCPEGDPGQFLLKEYCKAEKRALYRFGVSYAEFLAESDDITLNDCFVWIRGLTAETIEPWAKFIREYSARSKFKAVFILETNDESLAEKARKKITNISFGRMISQYDRYTFCALSAAGTDCGAAYRPYLAELVSTLCANDVELCERCVEKGEIFLEDPGAYVAEIAASGPRSDGTEFKWNKTAAQTERDIWKSQLRTLFPVIEVYRNHFVQRHKGEIDRCLPVTDIFGNVINDAYEVELGLLLRLKAEGYIRVNDTEYTTACLFRDARNALAHMNTVEWESAKNILIWDLRHSGEAAS